MFGDNQLLTLKLTAKVPENQRLEDEIFFLGWPIFRGELLVSGGTTSFLKPKRKQQVLVSQVQNASNMNF